MSALLSLSLDCVGVSLGCDDPQGLGCQQGGLKLVRGDIFTHTKTHDHVSITSTHILETYPITGAMTATCP